ncbi:gamma-glutamyl-gamma-aminobutyrate hydrolase family protein [Streptomyces xiamenensis]|uniref:gamma-glutamyl-gamma-aminobutyrate hydrolase family protein n=1 Tax=Streptomyces TaxID=1883 RepID=UPI0004CBF17A|nr:gamma-glutamyl-gamma-aminobutyrate hydrolase family protein [Streptomyces sp. NRRL F-2890]
MSTPPLIGISSYLEADTRYREWRQPAALAPAGYHQQVQRSGGLAVLLPPDPAPGAAAAAVARLDGLVISGGPDVAPERYGAARDPRTGPPAAERDAWELALIGAAGARRVPLLGICRGMQLLNVARGGTLLQHLDEHGGPVPGSFGEHKVTPVPGTLLAGILPGPVAVPTYHHQAVQRLGAGLIAGAHAADGTVEAVEDPAAPALTLAVQWHPEAADDTRLMTALVRAATG